MQRVLVTSHVALVMSMVRIHSFDASSTAIGGKPVFRTSRTSQTNLEHPPCLYRHFPVTFGHSQDEEHYLCRLEQDGRDGRLQSQSRPFPHRPA